MARATTNLAPGITFAIAAVIGYVTVYSVLFLLPFLSPFSLFCFVFEESLSVNRETNLLTLVSL